MITNLNIELKTYESEVLAELELKGKEEYNLVSSSKITLVYF